MCGLLVCVSCWQSCYDTNTKVMATVKSRNPAVHEKLKLCKNKFEVTYMYNQNLGTNTEIKKIVTCSTMIIASGLHFPWPVVKALSLTRQ